MFKRNDSLALRFSILSLIKPTTLAKHYKLNKDLLILSVVVVYISGERYEKHAYEEEKKWPATTPKKKKKRKKKKVAKYFKYEVSVLWLVDHERKKKKKS